MPQSAILTSRWIISACFVDSVCASRRRCVPVRCRWFAFPIRSTRSANSSRPRAARCLPAPGCGAHSPCWRRLSSLSLLPGLTEQATALDPHAPATLSPAAARQIEMRWRPSGVDRARTCGVVRTRRRTTERTDDWRHQGRSTILGAALAPLSRSTKACGPSDSVRSSTQARSPNCALVQRRDRGAQVGRRVGVGAQQRDLGQRQLAHVDLAGPVLQADVHHHAAGLERRQRLLARDLGADRVHHVRRRPNPPAACRAGR